MEISYFRVSKKKKSFSFVVFFILFLLMYIIFVYIFVWLLRVCECVYVCADVCINNTASRPIQISNTSYSFIYFLV